MPFFVRFPFLIPFLPKPPSRTQEPAKTTKSYETAPTRPAPPFRPSTEHSGRLLFVRNCAAFRHPEHSPVLFGVIVCLDFLRVAQRVASSRRNSAHRPPFPPLTVGLRCLRTKPAAGPLCVASGNPPTRRIHVQTPSASRVPRLNPHARVLRSSPQSQRHARPWLCCRRWSRYCASAACFRRRVPQAAPLASRSIRRVSFTPLRCTVGLHSRPPAEAVA